MNVRSRRLPDALARSACRVVFAVGVLLGSPAHAQRPCEGPQNAGDRSARQVEMAISVDPNDPARQVIAVTKPSSGSAGNIFAWYTTDGGRSWSETPIDPPADPAYTGSVPYSDPAVTHDDLGNVHVVHLLNPRGGDRAIVASKSTDGGATYVSRAVEPLRDDVVLDKPWIVADREPGSPGLGNVYVVWSWVGDITRSYLSRSEDRGETWSPASHFASSTFFASAATGPDGEVYAIWFTWGGGDRSIKFGNLGVEARAPFNPGTDPVLIADIADGFPIGDPNAAAPEPFLAASPSRGVYPVPSIAVDLSDGPHRGRIWVAYTDYTDTGDPERMNPYVEWSDDGGATWSAPVNLGEPDSAQLLPWLSVDPVDGSVGLVYYSTEDDAVTRAGVHVYYRSLSDGSPAIASHWVKRRLSATISTPADDGDHPEDYREYIGLDERHNVAYASWTSRHFGSAQMMVGQAHGALTQAVAEGTDESGDRYGHALAIGDFDGDGYRDLAIGAPGEDDQATDDGYVAIHYGSPDGLGTRRWERIGQTAAGAASETDDRFGEALAAGDFDGDGFDDLGVGVPGEDGVSSDEGAVVVFYGSPDGLLPADADVLDQGVLGLDRGTDDRFGAALAAGDFDGDGFDELAVGAPTEDDLAFEDGNVVVLFGSSQGLSATGWERLRLNQAGVTEADSDRFGESLAAGDFDGDGRDDLAVGIPLRDDEATDSGNVVVFFGSTVGLLPANTERLSQPDAGRPSENGDRFGGALATADFDGDGRDDLAVGVPDEFQNAPQDGTVIVYYGAVSGLLPPTTELLTQTRGGEVMEADDRFGAALAGGDLDGDGFDDLVAAIPNEDDTAIDEGTVVVFHGSTAGLIPERTALLRQSDVGLAPESNDRFGNALAIGDFNGDCLDDLAAGVALEDLRSIPDAGAVAVLYGIVIPAGDPDGLLAPPRARVTGDVNCDGCVDREDRRLVQDGLGQPNRCGTDVNGDGAVDVGDLELQLAFCDLGRDADGTCAGACGDRDCDGYGPGGSPDCALGTTVDCADGDPLVQELPGEVRGLALSRSGGAALLDWSPPLDPGGEPGTVLYDVVRSGDPADFAGPGICVETDDGADTSAVDPAAPASGAAYHYLVRAGNTCGEGSAGLASSGAARAAIACP